MGVQLFTNNASTTINGPLTTGSGFVSVASPGLFPSPSNGDWFIGTLQRIEDDIVTAWEIVKVTAVTGGNLTIERAQENTPAATWDTGDTFALLCTAGGLGQFLQSGNLYPMTLAEALVGAVLVNKNFPPMYVDRYTANTNPGITDMSPGFNTAWKVAQVQGGTVKYGASGQYGVSNPINFTSAPGTRNWGITVLCDTGFCATNFPGPSIVPNHTGIVVDWSGSSSFVAEKISIGAGSAVPIVGHFQSRLTSGASVGLSRFRYCSALGPFSIAAYYDYGAEDDQLDGCYWHNTSPVANACALAWTGQNYAGVSSTFQTVATGAVSCIDHKVFGGELYMESATDTADCIHLEQASSLKIYGPWMLCGKATVGGGRSLIYVDLSLGDPTSAPAFVDLQDITGEDNGADTQGYGILFSNQAKTVTTWKIDSCKLTNTVNAIACAGNSPTLDNFRIRNIAYEAGGGGMIANIVQNSNIEFGTMPLDFGTSANNVLTGYTDRITIVTARSKDNWVEQGILNRAIAVVPTSGITSSAGPLIARANLLLNGSCLEFEIELGSTSGNLAIAVGATLALVSPGGQSFAPLDSGACMVVDTTSGVISGASVTASGSNTLITVPVAIAATPHNVIISGTVFLA